MNRFNRNAIIFVVALTSACGIAFSSAYAQTGTTVTFEPIITLILDYVTEAVLVILTGLAVWLARWLKLKLGIDIENNLLEIEAKHRSTLRSAIDTGLRKAIEELAINKPLEELTIDVKNRLISEALQHVIGPGAQDAVDHFNLGVENVKDLILSRLPFAFDYLPLQKVS